MIDIYSQEADKELVFTNLFEVVKKYLPKRRMNGLLNMLHLIYVINLIIEEK